MRKAFIALALVLGFAVPAYAAAPKAGPLVDAKWVIDHANDDNVVLIDIRDDIEKTDLGDKPYIANAALAPYGSSGWRTEINGTPGMLPKIEDVAALIESLGVNDSDHVVIIPWGTDSSEFGAATRVYWTFKYLGHDAVSILDGGWRQYHAAGGPEVATAFKPQKGSFTPNPQEDLLATTDEVVAAVQNGTKLIDGRPAAQFRGESKSPVARVAGTIPGAVNLENSKLYSAEYASFARPETVKALADAIDLAQDQQNIVFCNTGHWASVVWFGLHEILGDKQTSLYDGSLAAWTADKSRPVQ